METTEDIREATADLKLLNKRDFRHLMKWRSHMRAKTLEQPERPPEASEERELTAEEREEALANELDAAVVALEKRKKRKLKKWRAARFG